MTIKTRFDIGDEVRPGITIHRIIVRYDSQYSEHSDIHYVLSDGFYKSEKEVMDEIIGQD